MLMFVLSNDEHAGTLLYFYGQGITVDEASLTSNIVHRVLADLCNHTGLEVG